MWKKITIRWKTTLKGKGIKIVVMKNMWPYTKDIFIHLNFFLKIDNLKQK